MKPTNYNTENCESKSSNCIIWAGPKINCINLCPGDPITQAVNDLAEQLCIIMDQLKISNYDLTCLGTSGLTAIDFKSLINVLIQKVCSVNTENVSARTISNNPVTNEIVNLAPCFYYDDPSNGDQVITSSISDYVQRIGITICKIITEISSLQGGVVSLGNRVKALEGAKKYTYTLPNLVPSCIGSPLNPLSLDVFAATLELYVCELSQAVGSSTKIYNTITVAPADLNSAKALGTGGGTLGEKSGWVSDVKDLSDSVTNMWVILTDLRSAITNIKQNCCNTLCDGIRLTFNATLNDKILNLFFTGTIPSNLISCVAEGSLFKIEDYSGNSVNVTVNIKNNINNVSGYSVDLTSSPLNFADDLKVTSLFCFNDPDTGSVCQNFLETIVANNMNCPALTFTPGLDQIAYQFTHTAGTLTYTVQLVSSSNVILQAKTISVSSSVVISDLFTSLSSGTAYKVRVLLMTVNSTKTCPFTSVSTLPNPCPAALTASAVINII